MSKKNIYIILISTVVTVIIGFLIWYFFFKNQELTVTKSNVDFTVPDQKITETRLKVISEGPIFSLYKKNGAILFYDFSGQFWQLNENDAKPILIDQKPVENVAEIIWPKVFSPDNKKIVYHNSKNSSLFTSDADGKNQRTLTKNLSIRDVILKWPSANTIAIVSKPSGLVAGNVWFFDIRNLGLSKIIDNFFGLEALFSPDGNSFIYSYTNQNGHDLKLAVYDKKGNSKVINNVSTLVDKCVFTENSLFIYCAVPKLWPDSINLPDEYYKNAFETNDDVWKINVETGEKTLVTENLGGISNLVISEDENKLFFISKANQFLYKLVMK